MTLRIFKANLGFLRPTKGGGERILSAGGRLQSAAYHVPELERSMTGRLDLQALIAGKARVCWREEHNDGGHRGGVDIFVQCALLGAHDQSVVDKRALASLNHAVKLMNEGTKVNLYACWVSESTRRSGVWALAWAEIGDLSLDYLAAVIDTSTFRDMSQGIMAQRGAKWPADFDSHGGAGYTVERASTFKNILTKGGVLTPDGVVLDWDNDNQPL